MELTLASVLDDTWQQIAKGAGAGHSPLTLWQLATVNEAGHPQLRMVVLRAFTQHPCPIITFHTDIRSAKIAELLACPQCAINAWDPDRQIQYRCTGRADVQQHGEQKEALWQQARSHSRRPYMRHQQPGTVIDDPQAQWRDMGDERTALSHFCVVNIQLQTIEWLNVAAPEQQRAHFDYAEQQWHGHWLVP